MAFRIPAPKLQSRVTVSDAFNHILCAVFVSDAICGDLAASLYFASVRIAQTRATPKQARHLLAPMPQFQLDPVDVANAILEGIKAGELSVSDMPDAHVAAWLRDPWIDDWSLGTVHFRGKLGFTFDERAVRPKLDLVEVEALFGSHNGSELPAKVPPSSQTPTQRVAVAELKKFVHGVMAVEGLHEAGVRARAVEHFAPKAFTDPQWREAFKDAPNKLARGQRRHTKSGS